LVIERRFYASFTGGDEKAPKNKGFFVMEHISFG
jgi:hypothetical protein